MMNKKFQYFILLVEMLILSACLNKSKEKSTYQDTRKDFTFKSEIVDLHKEDFPYLHGIDSIYLFENLILYMHEVKSWKLETNGRNSDSLTIIIFSDPRKAYISLFGNEAKDITITKRIITSMSLVGDDGFITLQNWKHFYAIRNLMSLEMHNRFALLDDTDEIGFPDFSKSELDKAIGEYEHDFLANRSIFDMIGSQDSVERLIDVSSIELQITSNTKPNRINYFIEFRLSSG